ncbi:MAG: insulinase family protein [Deltaproteobacteria bacterium]|nr:insulinase family protein [Deltaproteobacteria bacterium]
MKSLLLSISIAFLIISCSSAKPIPVAPQVEGTQSDDAKPVPKPQADVTTWRKMPPEVGPAPEVVIPVFEQTQLPNGLTVMVVRRDSLPLVDLSLVLVSGSASEEIQTQGIADLTYEMMLEGAGDRDGVELAEAFADLGSQIGVLTTEDGAAFETTLLKKNLNAGLDLLAEIVMQPTFKKKDFLRKQKERMADLQSLMGNPKYLSTIATPKRIYGDSHPYAHPVMGMPKDVSAFKNRQLKAFYQTHVSPKNAALIFAGDITLDEAVAASTARLGKWKSSAGGKKTSAQNSNETTRRPFSLAIVAKPGMNQTIISAGAATFPAGHPDEWALRVAVDAFGGMFGSRLNMNLREEKGYTYGARGHLDTMFLDGAAVISTSVQADVTGAALTEIIAELDGLKTRPITEAEFHAAKENVLKSVSGWFESVSGLGHAAQSIFERHLPVTRYTDMVAAYEKLTLNDVRRAAATYLERSVMQVVLVGDPSVIKEQLAPLSLGTPEVLELGL